MPVVGLNVWIDDHPSKKKKRVFEELKIDHCLKPSYSLSILRIPYPRPFSS